MLLRNLEVENFRGIVSGRLDFDETTVLIGENDCGKSSLFSALDVALTAAGDGRPRAEPHYFYRSAGPDAAPPAPIRIALAFEERSVGEWRQEALGPLGALVGQPGQGKRRLALEIRMQPPAGESSAAVHWRIESPGSGAAPLRDDLPSLAMLRGLNPLVWLRNGMLVAATSDPRDTSPTEAPAAPDIAALAAEVESHYASLLSGTSANELDELKAGYTAARELLSRRAEEQRAAGNPSHAPIAAVLGGGKGRQQDAALPLHGSAAQQIGVLIVTAAIIRHGVSRWVQGTSLLLIVEDPEAHLHLMTLASVWGLLENSHAQMIIGTQSETLLAAAPISAIRRLTRHGGQLRQWRVREGRLSTEELRKLSYHVRARRGEAMFARCWLLVEGETEFWILPELARLAGYDFNLEGIAVVEFAQCGIAPLLRFAQELGIEWHVLADGDRTGKQYALEAQEFVRGEEPSTRVTRLKEPDIEHFFWRQGYADVYARVAGANVSAQRRITPRRVIDRAVKRRSKPYLALEILAAVTRDGSPGLPRVLERLIVTCVSLARQTSARVAGEPRRPKAAGRRRGRPGRHR